jgi:hypothetical protein
MRSILPSLLPSLTIALFSLVAACGGSDDASGSTSPAPTPTTAPTSGQQQTIPPGSCDAKHCMVAELHTCFQWSGGDAAIANQHTELCNGYGGAEAAGACPTKDAVAGCKTALSSTQCAINWGYAPAISAANVETDCKQRSGQFLPR